VLRHAAVTLSAQTGAGPTVGARRSGDAAGAGRDGDGGTEVTG